MDRPNAVRLAAMAVLLVLGAAAVVLDWPATLTDEDDYMPYALGDVLALRNPYATTHEETRTVTSPFGAFTYSWSTAYPYLPTLAVLQVPGLDYRWTALLAYAALLMALRDRVRAFWVFANPAVAWFAASGFNDFVPLAILAWAAKKRWGALEWIACGAKQFVLPLVAVDAALRREPRRLLTAAAATVLVTLPFVAFDAAAFWTAAIGQHVPKAQVVFLHWNYALYPLFYFAVMRPARREEPRLLSSARA